MDAKSHPHPPLRAFALAPGNGHPELRALRTTLDAVAPKDAAPGRLPGPMPITKRIPLDSRAANVWGVPRPGIPILSARQWQGLGCFALALACLWYLDILTTSWALRHGGVEGGPLAQYLVGHGMVPLFVAKAAGLAIIVLIAARQLARHRDDLARWSLGIVGALSLAVVEWNLLGILVLAGVLS